MTLPTFTPRTDVQERPPYARITTTHFACAACQEVATVDVGSGLCRPCWRVAVLWPAMWEAWRTRETRPQGLILGVIEHAPLDQLRAGEIPEELSEEQLAAALIEAKRLTGAG